MPMYRPGSIGWTMFLHAQAFGLFEAGQPIVMLVGGNGTYLSNGCETRSIDGHAVRWFDHQSAIECIVMSYRVFLIQPNDGPIAEHFDPGAFIAPVEQVLVDGPRSRNSRRPPLALWTSRLTIDHRLRLGDTHPGVRPIGGRARPGAGWQRRRYIHRLLDRKRRSRGPDCGWRRRNGLSRRTSHRHRRRGDAVAFSAAWWSY